MAPLYLGIPRAAIRGAVLLLSAILPIYLLGQSVRIGLIPAAIEGEVAAGLAFVEVHPFSATVQAASERSALRAEVREGTVLQPNAAEINALLAAAPERIALVIPTISGPVELRLMRADIFSSDFTTVLGSGERGTALPAGVHYRGMIAGQPTSLAAISIFAQEVMGFVSDAGGNHVLGRLQSHGAAHIYYAEGDLMSPPTMTCGTPDDTHGYSAEDLAEPAGDRSANCVRLYWEVDHSIYLDKGGLAGTWTYLTGLFNQHAVLFANDGVSVVLSQLYVWDVADPYTQSTTADLLDTFEDYRDGEDGDVAHLLGYSGNGGIAELNGLCYVGQNHKQCYSDINSTYSTVPTYSWSVYVITHEEGHVMGSNHTHACVWNGNSTAIDGCGPAHGYPYEGTCTGAPIPAGGGTLMSYCHLDAVGVNFNLGLGTQPHNVILNRVNTATCLTACGAAGCAVPSGQAVSGLSASSATLNWVAVSGATSYTLEWKPASAGTWTSVTGITAVSYPLTGLSSSTPYMWRVRTVCGGGSSSMGPSYTLTTACSPGGPCDDGDSGTANDVYSAGCVCQGTLSPGYFTRIAKVVASDRAADDHFGKAVDISGDYAIVAANAEDHNATGGAFLSSAGSVYIFARNANAWVQQQKIVASDRAAGDSFGYSAAIDGDYIIVGALWEDENAAGTATIPNAGSAYIFVRNSGTWVQQQKLVASDRDTNDIFGCSVAISGDYAIVGAFQECEDAVGGNTAQYAGSAYIFKRTGSTWTEQQKIVSNDRAAQDKFGANVAISGDQVIVAAATEDEDANGGNTLDAAGSAYVFVRNGSTWTQQQKLVSSDRSAGDMFGIGVDMEGDQAILGAYGEDDDVSGANPLGSAGSAYLFKRVGGTWTQQQKIVASDRGEGDWFGVNVGISGDHVLVAAYNDEEDASGANPLLWAGAAYLFKSNGGTWSQLQKICASDRGYIDQFASEVAIGGDHVLIAAILEDENTLGIDTRNNAGSVYFHSIQRVRVGLDSWLEGPYNTGTQLMNDGLRASGLLPASEPYTALGFGNAAGGGSEAAPASVFGITGNDAIVDWVHVELRSNTTPGLVVASRNALLQRDGDVVSANDGVSPISFNAPAGNYHVAVRHRNHLGCMTASPVALAPASSTLDFRGAGTLTYGTNARKTIGTAMALWAGTPVRDNPPPVVVKYTGSSNDRDPILTRVGSTTPNNAVIGYYMEDVNLDGTVRYTGSGNDRDPILVNVGSITPNNTRTEQLP